MSYIGNIWMHPKKRAVSSTRADIVWYEHTTSSDFIEYV